jgi:hypothetical protein
VSGLPFLFVAVFFGSVVLRSLFGRGLAAVIAGAASGVLVYLVGQALFVALVAALIAFLFTLISGFSGGGTLSSHPRTGGWGGGFGSGSSGAWGGGFRSVTDRHKGAGDDRRNGASFRCGKRASLWG